MLFLSFYISNSTLQKFIYTQNNTFLSNDQTAAVEQSKQSQTAEHSSNNNPPDIIILTEFSSNMKWNISFFLSKYKQKHNTEEKEKYYKLAKARR